MNSEAKIATKALNDFDKQEKQDQLKIYGSIAFFTIVVLYIVLKRIGIIKLSINIIQSFYSK